MHQGGDRSYVLNSGENISDKGEMESGGGLVPIDGCLEPLYRK